MKEISEVSAMEKLCPFIQGSYTDRYGDREDPNHIDCAGKGCLAWNETKFGHGYCSMIGLTKEEKGLEI